MESLINSEGISKQNIENFADIDLSEIFSIFPEKIEFPEGNTLNKIQREIAESDSGNGNMKAEMRQSAILEKIRQIGNCRLADIQQILPEVSDRTIRYDLETLVQKRLVERLGSGGRGAYYRVAGVPLTG